MVNELKIWDIIKDISRNEDKVEYSFKTRDYPCICRPGQDEEHKRKCTLCENFVCKYCSKSIIRSDLCGCCIWKTVWK